MSGSLRVRVEPARWSPEMSSSPGVGLLPDVDRPAEDDIRVRWRANFGRFMTESATHELTARGAELTAGREKVYWTYDLATAPTHRPPVRIDAEAVDWKTGEILVQTGFVLVWEGDAVRLR
jgi:hypothetical protein